jgi:hypothetical protein
MDEYMIGSYEANNSVGVIRALRHGFTLDHPLQYLRGYFANRAEHIHNTVALTLIQIKDKMRRPSQTLEDK